MAMQKEYVVEKEVTGAPAFYRRLTDRAERVASTTPLVLLSSGIAMLTFGVVMSEWMTKLAAPGILPIALIAGGFIPLFAGLYAYTQRRLVHATVFSITGALWLVYYMLADSFLAQIATPAARADFQGFLFLAWAGFALYAAIATFRLPVTVMATYALFAVALASECIGAWTPSIGWTQFGGWFAVAAGAVAIVSSLLMLVTHRVFGLRVSDE